MTFNKAQVLAAANTAGEEIRAERKQLLANWDSHNWLWKVWQFSHGRPEYFGSGDEKAATRLIFKATNATEEKIELSDYECDVLQPYWKN